MFCVCKCSYAFFIEVSVAVIKPIDSGVEKIVQHHIIATDREPSLRQR